MLHLHNIECKVTNLICKITIEIDDNKVPSTSKYNFDLWIDENYLLFNWNNIYKRITCPNKFDVKDLKNIEINYNKNSSTLGFELSCLPEEGKEIKEANKDKKVNDYTNNTFDILKLKRIVELCLLKVDGVATAIDYSYTYGFNGKFIDDTSLVKSELKQICRIKDPYHKSAVDRLFKREIDETKDFSREQYKLNFIELQVPEGLENPMNYTINFYDQTLNSKEEYTLKTICSKPMSPFNERDRQRIDNELVSILLAICYDIRTNAGELNCESGWTRSILSSVLNYFEPILNLESAIQIFLRRSLIYPLYRNYDLSRLCVEDTIQALQKGSKWILKQLILTYYSFLECENNRQLLNKYFIEDYIKYVSIVVTSDDLKFLAKNLKNSSLRTTKKHLRLQLVEIETELLKELISDIHLANSDDSDDSSDISDDENNSSFSETSDENDDSPLKSLQRQK